jgi:hypothetical protein
MKEFTAEFRLIRSERIREATLQCGKYAVSFQASNLRPE